MADPAVYVDAAIHPWRGRMWCHLFSLDLGALHAFAAGLGLQRRWFQQPPKASWPHYDITAAKRLLAIRRGAVEVSRVDTMILSAEAMLTWCESRAPELALAAAVARNRWRDRYPDWAPPAAGGLPLEGGGHG